jgi:hypothetical protein
MCVILVMTRVGHNHICRVGQNRVYTPYMTVYLVISLPNVVHKPYIYIYMVLANPTHMYGVFGRDMFDLISGYMLDTVLANPTYAYLTFACTGSTLTFITRV